MRVHGHAVALAALLLLLALSPESGGAEQSESSCPAGDPKCNADQKGENVEAKGKEDDGGSSQNMPLYAFGMVSVLGLSYLFKAFVDARQRFLGLQAKASKLDGWDATLSDYIKWRFSHWCSWTSGSQGIILACLSLVILILGGLMGKFIAGQGLGASVWIAWAKLIAPDGGADGEDSASAAVGMVVSFAGLLVFALFVSMISDAFNDALEGLKTGRYAIVEEDHIVILGWNAAAPMLVEELCTAAGDDGVTICVLSEQPKPEIEEMIRDELDLKNAYIGVRHGKTNMPDDLQNVSIRTARSVIVLTDPAESREEQDAKTLRVLLALQAEESAKTRHVVVQCCLPTNKGILQDFGGANTEVVVVDDYVGGLLVQCSRRTGIASIFQEIFGFDGDEIYIKKIPGTVGKTFDEVMFSTPDATFVGLMTEGQGENASSKQTKMLPPGDYVIRESDEIIYFSEDDKVPRTRDTPIYDAPACRQAYGHLPQERKLTPSQLAQLAPTSGTKSKTGTKTEVIWILGWNAMGGTLLSELDRMVGPDSEVHIYSPTPAHDREKFLTIDQENRSQHRVQNLTLTHHEGKLGDRHALEDLASKLPFQGSKYLEKQILKGGESHPVSCIFVLAEQSAESPKACDEKTLSLLVLLQHILLDLGLDAFPNIIPETMCKETDEMCLAAGCQDYISSQRIVSRVLSAIAWTPRLNTLFTNILEHKVSYFTIGPLTSYLLDDPGWDKDTRVAKIKDLFQNKEVSFFECQAVARNLNEIVIGWTREGAVPEGFPWTQALRAAQAKKQGLSQLRISGFSDIWEINPPDKFKKRKWIARDRLVFVSKDFVAV